MATWSITQASGPPATLSVGDTLSVASPGLEPILTLVVPLPNALPPWTFVQPWTRVWSGLGNSVATYTFLVQSAGQYTLEGDTNGGWKFSFTAS